LKTVISPDALSTAQAFADFLAEKVSLKETFHIALSGGSTPKILFELLADEYDEDIDWGKIHFWWGDERCVPPTDEESNYKMTKERLFDAVDIHEFNIHRVIGENDPEQEAIRYSKEVMDHLPQVNGLPHFDLIMLGMGDDGHTASIFPHQMELLASSDICGVATHPESGQKRVTLNGPVINNAADICFLVTGEGKAEKVDEIFNQKEGYRSYPASHFNGDNVVWFLDNAAAMKMS
jgi:6-phosphogluconolactonase